ncbi:MAG: adenosylcobinamide-GDP ribazoletransferase [Firmicutes bacterium]|nr:adenosylcobinamide-GDP ribazoletransferase [Bacillota bacterium]
MELFRNLRIAFGFLTIIPINPRGFEAGSLGAAVKFFPVVGLIQGLFIWGLLYVLPRIFPLGVAVWLTVFASAFLNGFIHWDGLADTADSLGSRDPEKSLMIMKDSRLGAFGVIGLCLLISGKIFALMQLTGLAILVIVSIPVISRWGMAVLLYTQPPVSQGLLQNFRFLTPRRDLSIATGLMLIVAVAAGMKGLFLLGITIANLFLMAWLIRKRWGGITGDILGASNELIELVCFLALNLKFRIN